MTPAGRLPRPDWMTAPTTLAVVAALGADGAIVRFVGGCVRDALLGRPSNDIDIASPDQPETVTRLLRAAGVRAVPTGLAFGTITAVADGEPFQVTTLRRDVETDGRHAKVDFTDDWVADAARRDFTFNAMFCDPDGTYYDPFDGAADLRAGRVRFVGDASQRITEDFLRLLRFFRFFAYFGRPPADPDALAACTDLAPNLARLSGERVRDEMLKLLAAPTPQAALDLLTERGIWPHFLPEASAHAADGFPGLRALVTIERRLGSVDPIRRLALLVGDGAAQADGLAERLRLSNAQRARLRHLLHPPAALDADISARGQRAALYSCGEETYRDLVLRAWALSATNGDPTDNFRLMWSLPDRWPVPLFPVTGKHLIELGMPPGRKVGDLLEAAEAWWIEQDFAPDHARLMTWARDRIDRRTGS